MSKKSLKLALGGLALMAALAAGAGEARAAVVSSPFGPDVPTRVIIGKFDNLHWIIWRSLATQECSFTLIGFSSGINQDYTVFTSQTVDNVWVPQGSWSTLSCGGIMGGQPINYNGHFLDVVLQGGDDFADMGPGDSWVLGEGGNDRIFSYNPTGLLAGGEGDDTLKARGTGFDQQLFGEAGRDCLEDENGIAGFFHCGPDRDTFVGSAFEAIDCEDVVPAC